MRQKCTSWGRIESAGNGHALAIESREHKTLRCAFGRKALGLSAKGARFELCCLTSGSAAQTTSKSKKNAGLTRIFLVRHLFRMMMAIIIGAPKSALIVETGKG